MRHKHPSTIALQREALFRPPGLSTTWSPTATILYTAAVGNGDAMATHQLQRKTSLAFDDRTLKTLRKHADRLNLSMSALMRLMAAKLEAGEIRL